MDDTRIHREDCDGLDERIDCVGCFRAEVVEILIACHDHMLMDPRNKGLGSQAFKLVTNFLNKNP